MIDENLDTLTVEELSEFIDKYNKHVSPKGAAKYYNLKNPSQLEEFYAMLALVNTIIYAAATKAAIQARVKGEIQKALDFESDADFAYDRLPHYARW